jgi:hypothetical protein
MSNGRADLEVGDLIEIKYRVNRTIGAAGDGLVDKWIGAEVIYGEADERRVARLADGQMTDIRPYMTWRRVASARTGDHRDC